MSSALLSVIWGIVLLNLLVYFVFLYKAYNQFGGYGLLIGLVFPQITVPLLAFAWKTKTKEPWLVGKQAIYWKIWAGLFPFVFIGGLVFFGLHDKLTKA